MHLVDMGIDGHIHAAGYDEGVVFFRFQFCIHQGVGGAEPVGQGHDLIQVDIGGGEVQGAMKQSFFLVEFVDIIQVASEREGGFSQFEFAAPEVALLHGVVNVQVRD